MVPFPYAAALLGTATELILPVFIALGLGTRFTTVALFIFNVIVDISYQINSFADATFLIFVVIQ
ncbi:MAG: DoxX family membrane protein [Thioploca sp.]|nr:DoxX family membrane protein [Thioploca sp.]